MEKIGNKIKYVREGLLKLSQEEFAIEIGVSQMLISYWEAGTRNPKGQNIDKIIDFCAGKGFILSRDLSIISDQKKELEIPLSWMDKEIYYLKELLKTKDQVIEELRRKK